MFICTSEAVKPTNINSVRSCSYVRRSTDRTCWDPDATIVELGALRGRWRFVRRLVSIDPVNSMSSSVFRRPVCRCSRWTLWCWRSFSSAPSCHWQYHSRRDGQQADHVTMFCPALTVRFALTLILTAMFNLASFCSLVYIIRWTSCALQCHSWKQICRDYTCSLTRSTTSRAIPTNVYII